MDKVLGTVWVKGSALLTFDIGHLMDHCNCLRHKSTLRTVLSISSRIYDVLGLVSPVVIPCRIMIQKILRKKLDWDQPLPEDIRQDFWAWVDDLLKLREVEVPCHYFSKEISVKFRKKRLPVEDIKRCSRCKQAHYCGFSKKYVLDLQLTRQVLNNLRSL